MGRKKPEDGISNDITSIIGVIEPVSSGTAPRNGLCFNQLWLIGMFHGNPQSKWSLQWEIDLETRFSIAVFDYRRVAV